VYDGCECPANVADLLTCNDDSCGLQSLVSFAISAAHCYKIRVGGVGPGFGGSGILTIAPVVTDPWPPNIGPCCMPHPEPTCQNCACTEMVCAMNSSCCSAEWTQACADLANQICGVCNPTTIAAANPPAASANPYAPGQPFRDVLDTGPGSALTAGIGGSETPPQAAIDYSQITVNFDHAPWALPGLGSIGVMCTGGPCPSLTSVTGMGAGPYLIMLSGAIPPRQCTTLTFLGTLPGEKLQYQSLPGDVDLNGTSNTQDLLWLLQRLIDGSANQPDNWARYNIDRNTQAANRVNTQDLLRLVQLLNGVNTTQMFNGATVAACP
jgi:hypothetical protein